MIRILLYPIVLPFRLLYFAYCRVRNFWRIRPLLVHSVPDRFTMHRPSGWGAIFVPQREIHYLDYLLFLRTLARARGVRHIVLRIPELNCAWSEVEEIARRVDDLRKNGRTVTAFMEGGNLKTLYIAAAADWRAAAPYADFLSARPAAEPLFVKKALQRVGVDVEVLTAGKYKSAGELFTRSNLSPPAREALDVLLRDLTKNIDERLASSPGLSATAAARLIKLTRDRAILSAEDLVRAGFIGEQIPSTHIEARETLRVLPIRKRQKDSGKTGDQPEAESETIELPDPDQVRRALTNENAILSRDGRERFRPLRPGRKRIVGLVALAGNMVGGKRSDQPRPEVITTAAYQNLFEGLREGPEEAVFIHINSPGGTSSGSELLFQSIRGLAEQKPVYAILGPVAASGGYYIALAAQKIYAARTTITGSVGVYAMHASFGRLYRRLGIARDRVRFGPTQDILSESAPLSKPSRALMRNHVAATYELFLNRAADARGKSVAEVKRVAEGRVWTGGTFAEAGMVDESLDVLGAIERYREECGYPDHARIQINFYPEVRTDLRSLFHRLPFAMGAAAASAALPKPLSSALEFYRPLLEENSEVVLTHWPQALLLKNL